MILNKEFYPNMLVVYFLENQQCKLHLKLS